MNFFTNLFIAAFRHIGSIILSIILIIVGAIWSDTCLYIGLFLLISNAVVITVSVIRMQYRLNYRSDDDPEFNEMMDNLKADPKAFLSEIMNAQQENKELHGKDLLTLSDDDLAETVYLQSLDITEDDEHMDRLTGARRTVHVLSLFDSEIQNGGLCQFFVNSSGEVAPFVGECLKAVGADEQLCLFNGFITENNIDFCDLESFKVSSTRGFIKQTKRFDFDAFDDKYYELPPLQEKITAYIRANIDEF